MKTISFSKVLDVVEDKGCAFGGMVVSTHKHSELAKVVSEETEIAVIYTVGQESLRVRSLQKLGFELVETIYEYRNAIYGKIKTVWKK